MFFRKSKRIKELEKENEQLRRLTNTLRTEYKSPLLMCEELNIEKVVATDEFPTWYGFEFMECEVKHRLFSELCPFIKIERAFREADSNYLIRASIRVVKER